MLNSSVLFFIQPESRTLKTEWYNEKKTLDGVNGRLTLVRIKPTKVVFNFKWVIKIKNGWKFKAFSKTFQ